MSTATLHTAADYARIFEAERQNEYPVIDAFEARMGYAIDRAKLEDAARVLACPLKKNPPNWQHGRVIYAAAKKYLADNRIDVPQFADLGTAKGFSALCLEWALRETVALGQVCSVDVIHPHDKCRRNTVAELDGLLTLDETLAPWPEARNIWFAQSHGYDFLRGRNVRTHVAFIDDKHEAGVVCREGQLLAKIQEPGDIAIFDDLQLVGDAVDRLEKDGLYAFERLWIKKDRGYAVGVRRG